MKGQTSIWKKLRESSKTEREREREREREMRKKNKENYLGR